ncbi:MAG: nitroreductase family protein [Eubacteriales bacterium]|nr:nitroreductase family protein [Eubacteriales bacterium]
MNSIFKRRSIRKFEEKQVEQEKIEKLLAAGMAAPTARNLREWEFVVVTEREILNQLRSASPYAGPLAKAPMAIVPLVNRKAAGESKYCEQDLGAACQNILVEAVELGLGGVWLGIAPVKERMKTVSDILKLPDYVQPFSILALGYPAEEKAPHEGFEEGKVHYNRYGARE